jgi:hypothetical protein
MRGRNAAVHRKVNILQYVKTGSKWTWMPIPKNGRDNGYLWNKLQSQHLYLTWREHNGRRYQKAGSTPSEALEAKRRKEYELAGKVVLENGWKTPNPAEPEPKWQIPNSGFRKVGPFRK